MNFRRVISRLLAIPVIVGLIAAPLVTPAVAKGMTAGDMTASATAPAAMTDDMSAMAADMPCCPDQKKTNDCQDCPLVATCMLKTTQAAPPAAAGILVRQPARGLLIAFDDLIADGLDRPPPEHPPRSLV